MSKRKFGISIPGISVKIPRIGAFTMPALRLRLPIPTGIYVGGGKLVLIPLATLVLGFLAGMFLLISKGDQQLTWPMAGASYTAPSMVGTKVVDKEAPTEVSQTLQLTLPAGIRLDKVEFINVSLGKQGLDTAFQIVGTTSTYIVVENLIIRNSEFPSMTFDNADFFTLNATSSVFAAGHTFNLAASTSTVDYTVGSLRGVATYQASDMTVDRIIIMTSGFGTDIVIGELILDGVRASVGTFDLDYVKAGTLTLENLRVGDDGDIESPDLIMNVSVTTSVDGVVDRAIFIR